MKHKKEFISFNDKLFLSPLFLLSFFFFKKLKNSESEKACLGDLKLYRSK